MRATANSKQLAEVELRGLFHVRREKHGSFHSLCYQLAALFLHQTSSSALDENEAPRGAE